MEWLDKLFNVGIFVVALGYFKWWLGREFEAMKSELKGKVNDVLCKERSKVCSDDLVRSLDSLEKNLFDGWAVINKHGHKGLIGEANQVVRL